MSQSHEALHTAASPVPAHPAGPDHSRPRPAPRMSSTPQTRAPQPGAATSAIIDPGQSQAWAAALAALDPTARFLADQWMPLLAETYGYRPRLATLARGSQLAAALPFIEVASPFTGKRGVSLPFFDHCRSYNPDPADYPALYEAFKQHGHERGWKYLELRGDFRKLNGVAPSLSFYHHIVDLSGGPEAVFARMASSAQRAVRKALKEGVRIEVSQDLSAMRDFFRLQCITRKRHGLPPQPFRFFENLHRRLIATHQGAIITARVEGLAVASSVYLVQGDIVHYKYGASDTHYQNARVNNLIMWTALERYAQQGFAEMHLGRNSLENQGLRRYKLSYGSNEGITNYHRLDLRTNTISQMTDDVYGWHNRIFAALPIPLARLAGSLLYKHIA